MSDQAFAAEDGCPRLYVFKNRISNKHKAMDEHPLKRIRVDKDLSQKDLSVLSGVRQATVSGIERRRHKPHRSTLRALAEALDCELEALEDSSDSVAKDWPFLAGLDRDLRSGLTRELVSLWTHHSTALEGNTLSAGDTRFVLGEGLTVSGHSLREHQEIHGHAGALDLIGGWLGRQQLAVEDCHQAHRLVQTGVVIDCFAPIGRWKVEANGTTAILPDGSSRWHDYAPPGAVPGLMKRWLNGLNRLLRQPPRSRSAQVAAFTQTHLGFTAIHPYADGNGRLARLFANLPLLAGGAPPLLVDKAKRRDYLELMGAYSIHRGPPSTTDPDLVGSGPAVDALAAFFDGCWDNSLELVDAFSERQRQRRG
jgi:transcriptional regulator with XRE-family HTH domain